MWQRERYTETNFEYVVSRIDEGRKASEIIKDANTAKAIHWLQVALKNVSTDTIIH